MMHLLPMTKLPKPEIYLKLFIVLSLFVMGGCASSGPVRTLPIKVQSDPLGAYVVFQVQADAGDLRSFDWIYLGNTPVDTRRAISKEDLKRADSFRIKVMREGYIDQEKAWTGEQMIDEIKSKGAVFWNPRMVPSS